MSRMRTDQKAGTTRKFRRIARRTATLALTAVVLTSCGSWKGIANVPLPGWTRHRAGTR